MDMECDDNNEISSDHNHPTKASIDTEDQKSMSIGSFSNSGFDTHFFNEYPHSTNSISSPNNTATRGIGIDMAALQSNINQKITAMKWNFEQMNASLIHSNTILAEKCEKLERRNTEFAAANNDLHQQNQRLVSVFKYLYIC